MLKARDVSELPSVQKRLFILCWLAYAVAYLGRYNLTVALTHVQKYFGTDYTHITLLVTSFLWVYASGQLICGYIGDKVNPRYFVFIGLCASALLNVALGIVHSFPMFLLLWSFNGVAQAMLWGPIIRLLGHWFDGAQRDNVIFVLCTSMSVGTLLAWGGLGFLLSSFSWRLVFVIPAVLIAVIAVPWLVLVRPSPKDAGFDYDVHKDTSSLEQKEKTKGLLKLSLSLGLPLVILCCIANGTLKDGISQLGPTLVQETSNISLKQLPLYLAFIPVMNLFGVLLARKLFKAFKGDGGTACAAMFAVASISAFVLFLASKNIWVASLCMGICSMTMNGINSILLGIVPVRFSKYGKASAVAGVLDFTNYAAAGLFVALGGFLRDITGSWAVLFLFWTLFAALGILASLLYRRSNKQN